MHDLVIKTAKDAGVNVIDVPTNYSDPEESMEDVLDRLSFSPENIRYEDNLIRKLHNYNDISILNCNEDIWKCFAPYERYLIYLHDTMGLTNRQILSILRFENNEELEERLSDIKMKSELIANEGD